MYNPQKNTLETPPHTHMNKSFCSLTAIKISNIRTLHSTPETAKLQQEGSTALCWLKEGMFNLEYHIASININKVRYRIPGIFPYFLE